MAFTISLALEQLTKVLCGDSLDVHLRAISSTLEQLTDGLCGDEGMETGIRITIENGFDLSEEQSGLYGREFNKN